ncbi:hypothetical protein MKW92_037259 [Papaver armeniacum]|nr:hypothetical protein MKW92_037259 [Papaver armeniacum]
MGLFPLTLEFSSVNRQSNVMEPEVIFWANKLAIPGNLTTMVRRPKSQEQTHTRLIRGSRSMICSSFLIGFLESRPTQNRIE